MGHVGSAIVATIHNVHRRRWLHRN
jgi:hypothetical protein